jgi:hypothetical protein
MSSVAACHDFNLHRAPVAVPASASACAPGGIIGRIFAAIERSRQRRLEQDAGRFIASHGARVTDDVERQLGEHFSGGFLPYRTRPFRPFAGGQGY